MPNSSDLLPTLDFAKIFLLGDYGTGKSHFASTCPTPGFVFDFDQRIQSYRGKNFDYETFKPSGQEWVRFEKVFNTVKADVKAGKYLTVVWDSVTASQDLAMERALQLDPKRSAEGGPIWNVHFQIVKNLLAPKLNQLLTFPCNIVVNGHWAMKLDSKTGDILSIDPLLVGQLSEKIPGYFDEVYASFTRPGGKFVLRTTAYGMYKARSTMSGPLHLLPNEIPNEYSELKKHMETAASREKQAREADSHKSA